LLGVRIFLVANRINIISAVLGYTPRAKISNNIAQGFA
jgi:hypothetical protein